jgi:hypothetical protein
LIAPGRSGAGRRRSTPNGGLFVDGDEALRFARFENGYRPHALMMVPGVIPQAHRQLLGRRHALHPANCGTS